MNLSARGLLASPRLGAFLALLAAGILWPSTAQGGCLPHYITSRLTEGGVLPHLEMLGTLALSQDGRPAERPSPPPCTSAMCSGNPAAPGSTTPAVPFHHDGDPAILGLPFRVLGANSGRMIPEEPGPRPLVSPLAIFHPPRS